MSAHLIDLIANCEYAEAHTLIKKMKTSELNKADRQGYTVLISACGIRGVDETIIEALLKHTTINVTLVNSDGNSALHYYCQNSGRQDLFPNILNLFSKRGGVLSLRNNIGETPLFKSLFNPNLVFFILPFFYSIGLDFHVTTLSGDSLLHYAVRIGNSTMVKMLVEDFKIDVGIRNKFGQLPVDLAHFPPNEEVINYLTPISPCSELTSSGLAKPLPHFSLPDDLLEESEEEVSPKTKDSNSSSPGTQKTSFSKDTFFSNLKRKTTMKVRPTQSLPAGFGPSTSTPDIKSLTDTAHSIPSSPSSNSSLSTVSTSSVSSNGSTSPPSTPAGIKGKFGRTLTSSGFFEQRKRSLSSASAGTKPDLVNKDTINTTTSSLSNSTGSLGSGQDVPKPFQISDDEASAVRSSLEYALSPHSEIEHKSTGAVMINDLFFSKLFELKPDSKTKFPSIQKQSRFISELLSTIRVVVDRPETARNFSVLKVSPLLPTSSDLF